ncbi:MAG: hypothetical protein M1825_000163 [Sarcosagium campestre]|nr:MAG: hypothetical protein M1825_000163 [Sarcosagium campestre]
MNSSARQYNSGELLVGAMSRLLRDGENSDMIIKCENLTFKAHRCIVYPSSDFFKAAIEGHFEESKLNEVRLVGDDPASVERMMSYIYTFDYPVPDVGKPTVGFDHDYYQNLAQAIQGVREQPKTEGEEPTTEEKCNKITPLEVHAQMYEIGDKYSISGLKELSQKNLIRSLQTEFGPEKDLNPFLNVRTQQTDVYALFDSTVISRLSEPITLTSGPT